MGVIPILHPTDFSSASAIAYELACALARDQAKPLVLLHVLEPARPDNGSSQGTSFLRRQDARNLLERMREQARDVWIETLVTRGAAALVIVSLARDLGSNLIVMGMQGQSRHASRPGRIAEEVARHAACRVLRVQGLAAWETQAGPEPGHNPKSGPLLGQFGSDRGRNRLP